VAHHNNSNPGRNGPAKNPKGPPKGGSRRVSRRLVVLSSAAILAVYAVGYANTQSAADTIAEQQGQAAMPPAPTAGPTDVPPAPTSTPIPVTVPSPVAALFRKAQAVPTRIPTAIASDDQTSSPAPSPATQAPPTAGAGSTTADIPTAIPTAVPTRAPAPTSAPTVTPTKGAYRDGTYKGMGFSRHGNIGATVVISGGKIVSANVTQCLTRYSCSLVSDLVQEVIQTQKGPVDYVSGATDSSQAYYGAISQALAQAK
jgi:uncharacterized protein with FMN-binding domain